MNNEHKPCPFCGSKDVGILQQNHYVECKKCGCFGPSPYISPFSNLQKEIVESMVWDQWNRRGKEDEQHT
jgi:Lar family restriction alleviation protein